MMMAGGPAAEGGEAAEEKSEFDIEITEAGGTKIAVIKTGGKQYTVKEGDKLKIEKIDKKENAKIKFETLMIATTDGKDVDLGKPSLGAKVEAKILEHDRAKKINVVKYKNKTRYLRNKGHRQNYTEVEILSIA